MQRFSILLLLFTAIASISTEARDPHGTYIATNTPIYLDFSDCDDIRLGEFPLTGGQGASNILSLPEADYFHLSYALFKDSPANRIQNINFTQKWGYPDFSDKSVMLTDPMNENSFYVFYIRDDNKLGIVRYDGGSEEISTIDESGITNKINSTQNGFYELITAHEKESDGEYVLAIVNPFTESIELYEADLNVNPIIIEPIGIDLELVGFNETYNLRSGISFSATGDHLIIKTNADSNLYAFQIDYEQLTYKSFTLDLNQEFGTDKVSTDISWDGKLIYVVKNIENKNTDPQSVSDGNRIYSIATENLLEGRMIWDMLTIRDSENNIFSDFALYDIGLLPDGSLGLVGEKWDESDEPELFFAKTLCLGNQTDISTSDTLSTYYELLGTYNGDIGAFSTPAFGNYLRSDFKQDLISEAERAYYFCDGQAIDIELDMGRCGNVMWHRQVEGKDTIYGSRLLIENPTPEDYGEWFVSRSNCGTWQLVPFTIINGIEISPEFTVLCKEGDEIELTATSGFQYYRWYRDGLLIDEGDFKSAITVSEPGSYTVEVDAPGCDGSDVAEVEIFEGNNTFPDLYVTQDCETEEITPYIYNPFSTPIEVRYRGQSIILEAGATLQLPTDLVTSYADMEYYTNELMWNYGIKCGGGGELEFELRGGVSSGNAVLLDRIVTVGERDTMDVAAALECAGDELEASRMVIEYDADVLYLNSSFGGSILSVEPIAGTPYVTATVELSAVEPKLEFTALLSQKNYTDVKVLAIGSDNIMFELGNQDLTITNGSYTIEELCPTDNLHRVRYFRQLTMESITIIGDNLELILDGTNPESASLKIYDTMGQIVYESQSLALINNIDISNLASGRYVLQITSMGRSFGEFFDILR